MNAEAEMVAGNLLVIMELTGARNVQVHLGLDHPEAWTWHGQWE